MGCVRALEHLFTVALLLYSTVIWTHWRTKKLRPWMAYVFGLALLTDATATVTVCWLLTGYWSWSFHTLVGIASLLVMGLHFLWALGALTYRGRLETYFRRYSLAAWSVWLVSFVTGFIR